MALKLSAFIRCFVAGINGTCTETKSAFFKTSSTVGQKTAPDSFSNSSLRLTSYYKTFISKPFAAWCATREPILPSPIIPKVFFETSVPKSIIGSQPRYFTARASLSRSDILCAIARSNAKVCSATVSVKTPGVFVIITFFSFAAETSTYRIPRPYSRKFCTAIRPPQKHLYLSYQSINIKPRHNSPFLKKQLTRLWIKLYLQDLHRYRISHQSAFLSPLPESSSLQIFLAYLFN